MPESRFVGLVGIARSTYHSWENEGLLARPPTGAHTETHVVEALLLGTLRAHLPLAATRNAMRKLRAGGTLADVTDRFRDRHREESLDVVIEPDIGRVTICFDDDDVIAAVRDPHEARTVVVIPLAHALRRAMSGFDNGANSGRPPARRVRGRPRNEASIQRIRGRG